MNKPISRQLHGIIDYSIFPLVMAAPELAGFEAEDKAVLLCRLLSKSIAGTGLVTNAEWGFFKWLPFKAHVAIDIAAGLFTISAPWLFGFKRNARARNTIIAIGTIGLLSGLLSDTKER